MTIYNKKYWQKTHEAQKIRHQKWRKNNIERRRVYNKAWRQNHKRKEVKNEKVLPSIKTP
jgi:hypothetical protein